MVLHRSEGTQKTLPEPDSTSTRPGRPGPAWYTWPDIIRLTIMVVLVRPHRKKLVLYWQWYQVHSSANSTVYTGTRLACV